MDLEAIVKDLVIPKNPNVLVGLETNDDGGVYRIAPGLSMVLTADVIAPTCDDPRLFGRIAAANSMSDVYAMGGYPRAALNLCFFPPKGVDREILAEILRGGIDALTEAEAALIGGHTVKDNELKYGLSVTGLIDDRNIKTNAAARPGDLLILTKPIGTGVVMAAIKKGTITENEARPVFERMAQLNRTACALMLSTAAGSATDVTGFGLAGHAMEMAAASKVGIRFHINKVPFWPLAEQLVRDGIRTGVKLGSDEYTKERFVFGDSIAEEHRALVFDPQTSGGLLIAIHESRAGELLRRLIENGIKDVALCGEVFESPKPRLEFQP